MRDRASGVQVKRVISPVSAGDDSALVGQIIDHQGFGSAVYVIATGSINDADVTFAVLLEEGDAANLSDAAAVPDAAMVSQTSGTAPETAAAFQYNDDNEVRKLGYIGSKRYTRLTITPSGNDDEGAAALVAAVCVLGDPLLAPVTQATA
jgi:hypothetical protein